MMPSAPARAVAFCKFCASRPQLCVVVLAVVIRSNALLNGVVWDDRAAVTLNKDVNTTLTPSGNVWRDDYWGQSMALPDSHKSWRPLSTLSFRANFAVHSYRPGGYHFVNVMLHAWACAMVLKVANLVLDDSGLVAAALFAVHPVHTEAVASIVGRADVLCGALTLTAVYAHLRAAAAARRSRGLAWGFAAYACAGSASLAKEIGISSFGLFFALAVIDAVCKKKSRRSLVAGAAACGLATLGAAAMFLLHTARHGETLVYSWTVLENSVALEPRFLDRAMSYAHLHALYAAKLVWPLRLCYDYGWPCVAHVTSVGDARNAASLGLYAGVAVVVAVAVRGRSTAALRCVALTVVPFLPASQVALPVGTLLGERLLYLPSAGLCIAVAGLFRAVDVSPRESKGEKKKQRRRRFIPLRVAAVLRRVVPSTAAVARLQACGFSVLVLSGALRSLVRNADWRSERALFESSLDVCPGSLKVLNNLALVLLNDPADGDGGARDLPRARALLDAALAHKEFEFASAT